MRDGQDLGLVRRQLQRRSCADRSLASILLFLDLLIDGQDTNVAEYGFGDELLLRSLAHHDDVNTVIRKDEAAGAGGDGNLCGDGALTGRQQ